MWVNHSELVFKGLFKRVHRFEPTFYLSTEPKGEEPKGL